MNINNKVLFVRPSTKDDDTIITHHQQSSRTESASYRGSIAAADSTGNSVSFVAGVGSTVFGSLVLNQTEGSRWTLTHVYVEPDAREIGIGDALVLHAIDFLRSQKATWIGAQAQPGDRALKNLFERHGLVAQTIIVGRPVIDPSTEVDASQ